MVRLFNDRGSCLAGAVLTTDVRRGVVQLSTGAWFDPVDSSAEFAMCIHGNPNMLTRDIGTSKLSQGCSGQHALVQIERFTGVAPPVKAFVPPAIRTAFLIRELYYGMTLLTSLDFALSAP